MSLYCVRHVVERNEMQTLKMERIRGVTMTIETFERPFDFSNQEYLHDRRTGKNSHLTATG